MKPELVTDGRPEGPQILTTVSGARSTGPFDDSALAFASYPGKVPDYVIGTDWARVQQALAAPPATDVLAVDAPRVVSTRYAVRMEDEPHQVTRASYDDPPREPISYPSMDGGASYPIDAPQPDIPPDTQNPPEPAEAPRL